MKVKTSFWMKPIPDRNFDWEAIDDDTYEAGRPIGRGPAEQAAIADLMEQLEDPTEYEYQDLELA